MSAPWIVLGHREKLATDGPTLSLLRAAEDALQRASSLVIVGYSFGDAHINSVVRDWMLGDDTRTLTIVDKNFTKPLFSDFRESLIHSYGPMIGSQNTTARVRPLRGAAGEVLADAIRAEPLPFPEPYIRAEVKHRGHYVSIALTLVGPSLLDAQFMMEVSTQGSNEPIYALGALFRSPPEVERYTGAAYGQSVPIMAASEWEQGETIECCAAVPTAGLNSASIKCDARRLDLPSGHHFEIQLEASAFSQL
ncbi:hypothetical protein [uncultured Pseudokineococcus sp.]|uniref:hypothetical protein n=1 Tax=uncultured Pseudokineococcus sp. TaxID=1642928 RepID=UPI0026159175|nr:hypothetical protein [uncultured Pseudokineococcus sp.]